MAPVSRLGRFAALAGPSRRCFQELASSPLFPGVARPFLPVATAMKCGWSAGTGFNDKSAWESKGHMAAALGALALCSGGVAHTTRCEDAVASPAASEPSFTKKLIAEAVGTGIIVLGGCGVVCTHKYAAVLQGGHLAAVWGASVALAVYATRDISGAHLNPAVTASLVVNKDFPVGEAGPYVLAQTAGAAVAGAINYAIFRTGIIAHEAKQGIVRGAAGSCASFSGAFGMTPNPAMVSVMGGFACEVAMTSLLVFLIFAITDSENTVPTDAAGPVLIGTAVAVLVSIFGPVTGCGMNPARDLGPRLVTLAAGWGSTAIPAAWIYTLGPVLGGILGGAAYLAFTKK